MKNWTFSGKIAKQFSRHKGIVQQREIYKELYDKKKTPNSKRNSNKKPVLKNMASAKQEKK